MSDPKTEKLREEYELQTLDCLISEQDVEQRKLVGKAFDIARRDNPGGPVVFAARLLGVSRSRLARLLRKWEATR